MLINGESNVGDIVCFISQKITVTSDRFGSLTDSLQNLFEDMYVNTEVDLSAYRLEMNQPTPERDLSTFIDQMQRVSLQVILK